MVSIGKQTSLRSWKAGHSKCLTLRFSAATYNRIIMTTKAGTLADLSVVWAKIKGYPWWPATVNLTRLSKEQLLEDSLEKFKVYFVGETTQYYSAITTVPS